MTKGENIVNQLYVFDHIVDLQVEEDNERNLETLNRQLAQVIYECLKINSKLIKSQEQKGQLMQVSQLLGPLEATLQSNQRLNDDFTKYIVYQNPYKAYSQRMISIYKQGGLERHRVYYKGTNEQVYQFCTDYFNNSGDKRPLSPIIRRRIEKTIQSFEAQNLRCLFLGYRELQMGDKNFEENNLLKDITFVCLIGIREDTLQDGIGANVERLLGAHIGLSILDNEDTEKSRLFLETLGRQLPTTRLSERENLVSSQHFLQTYGPLRVIQYPNGRQRRVIRNEQEFKRQVRPVFMISQAQYKEKELLVTGFQQLRYTTAILGEQTMDSKLLKWPNIAICFGSRNDVIQQNSSVIVQGEDFGQLFDVIIYGRNLYVFIRKYFQMILTCNFLTSSLIFLTLLWDRYVIFDPAQILFINMIIDESCQNALCKLEPNPNILRGRILNQNDYILTPRNIQFIFLLYFYEFTVLGFLRFQSLLDLGFSNIFQLDSFCFSVLIQFQLFHTLKPAAEIRSLGLRDTVVRKRSPIAIIILIEFCFLSLQVFVP